MKTLTRQELLDLLMDIKGTTFISIESRTSQRLKSGNPFVSLEKVSKICGAIGFNYQNSVNTQRKKEDLEDSFESRPRKWGERIKGTCLVEHKGKHYLEVKVQSSESNYFQGNSRINIDKIKPWMYNSSSRQGVANQIILRDYSLANIKRIKINKEEYVIV